MFTRVIFGPARTGALIITRGNYSRNKFGDFIFIPKEFLYQEPQLSLFDDPITGWKQTSRRTGVVAKKVGMRTVWNEWMECFPVTVLEVPPNYVTQVKTEDKEGFYAIQVAAGEKKEHRATKPMIQHFKKAGVTPKEKVSEFRVTPDALLPLGSEVVNRHFLPGQYVDIQGISKGKGFQGGMKRWGFAGLGASHGVSVSHRSIGSTGQNQSPGKVFRGKKMPGHMGVDTITVKNLWVWKVDPVENTIYVRGCVPGCAGSWLRVRDAKNKRFESIPPFPTFVAPADEVEPQPLIAKMLRRPDQLDELTPEEEEIIRSSPNYANMVPLRKEDDAERKRKAYKPAQFAEDAE